MTKNASEIVENIINNRIDNDETIDAGIASDIVCNEKLMKLIDETSSWDVILKESSHNGSLIIASAALNRATRFKDAIPFLHITPKYLHEKALSVMEKYALTSEEFLFLATQHSNEKKKSIFFSKGVGYAKNYKESLVALDYLLRSKNSIQNQDLIFASISKTISFARKFKEES